MKPTTLFTVFAAVFALASVAMPSTAEAAIVRVKLKAEVSAPYLVVKPPRPIVRPRRITLHLHRPGVTHVRLFGHHHHHHVVRVGHWAPHYRVRARLRPHVWVEGPHIAGPSVHVHGPHVPEPRVQVHIHAPEVPRPSVHIHGPSVHVGGPKVHVGGHGHGHIGGHGHHHPGKGKFKVKGKGKGKIRF